MRRSLARRDRLMALVLRYKWWALGAEEEVSRGAWFRRQFQASLLINKHAASHLHIAHILFMIVGARALASSMPHPTSSPRYVAIPGARIILHNAESSFFSNGTGMWTALRETYTVPGTCSENTRAGSLPSAIHVFRYDYYRAAIYEGSREKLPRQARETTRIICERILFRIS